jgi:hypothetical protein
MNNGQVASNDPEQQSYRILGIILLIAGILFAQYSFLILENISLSALGISFIIIAITMIFLTGDSQSSEIVNSLIEGCYENVESQLNLVETSEGGIYLPTRENIILAYVPYISKTGLKSLHIASLLENINNVTQIDRIKIRLPLSSRLIKSINGKSIEEALNNILVEKFKTVRSIKFVESNKKIIVEMTGCNIENSKLRSNQAIGSFNTMVSGCVICYIKDKPLAFLEEKIANKKITAVFEVKESNE